MARICILSAVNIKHMSLISLYTSILEEREIPYDIVYMDKYNEEERIGAEHIYRFVNVIDSSKPRLLKALQYFRFIPYAKKVLERNAYDFIIVWNDIAILMFGNYLARKWKKKYCLNIRDYCLEHIKPVYWTIERAIRASTFTTISSEGYKAFLPEYNYVYVQSLNMRVLDRCQVRSSLVPSGEKIRVGFLGYVRFLDRNQKLLDAFANDDRFEIHFHGAHSEQLQNYATEHGIENAVFSGSFQVDKTPDYLGQIDILNNLYGSGRPSVDYALSIKLYYSIFCRIPILVNRGTFMQEKSESLGLGFAIADEEIDANLPDRLYDWYQSLVFSEIDYRCAAEIEAIRLGNRQFERELNMVLEKVCN